MAECLYVFFLLMLEVGICLADDRRSTIDDQRSMINNWRPTFVHHSISMIAKIILFFLHRSKVEEAKSKNESISSYKYYFHDDKMNNVYLFIGATLFSVVLNMCSSLSFFWLTVNSSKNLHDKMLQALLKTTMYFFDSTPLGMCDTVHISRFLFEFSCNYHLHCFTILYRREAIEFFMNAYQNTVRGIYWSFI